MIVDRRQLLQISAVGAGLWATPAAAQLLTARGFTHGVASGEPSQRSVLLWTRFASPTDTRLAAEISDSSDFGRIIRTGEVTATAERDCCAKLVIDGLDPGRWYFYRFRSAGGETSLVGRTRTLPEGPTSRFSLGVFSCSNLPFGWFNAYAHAGERPDLDLIVHLGDYLYEYRRGIYPGLKEAMAGRNINPEGETVSLADYRLRFAAYRADPDLARLHQMFPMIAMWDDHELTNNAWRDGADNHQPEEGDWATRKAAAIRAYREWMPVSDADFTTYQVGDLATIFRPETRSVGRDVQLTLPRPGDNILNQLQALRDGPWSDPRRSMLGAIQESQLAEGLAASVRARTRWQVLAQQTIVGKVISPPERRDWLPANASDQARRVNDVRLAAASIGLPNNFDQWDGYPAARSRLLTAALSANANLVTLSGDSHNAWAFDLQVEGNAAGVDLAVQSVTSPGNERSYPHIPPSKFAASIIAANPELRWANTKDRGYLTVHLLPESVIAEWHFVAGIRQRSTALAGSHRMTVAHGTNRLA